MAYILLNATRIQQLVFEGLLMSPIFLTIPLHLCPSTLRVLVITVDPETISAAHHIGQLKLLQEVKIISHADWDRARDQPWNMPELRSLDWVACRRDPSYPRYAASNYDLTFLNLCRFPGLHVLRIAIRRHETPPQNETDALRQFYTSSLSNSNIHTLGLYVARSQYREILPSLQVTKLDLMDTPLSPSMLPFHPSVRTLCTTTESANPEGLWQLLDYLSKNPSSLEEIRINPGANFMKPFTWALLAYETTDIPPTVAEFLGRLLPFAVRLGQRGIRVVD
jgi:hypothetical protein